MPVAGLVEDMFHTVQHVADHDKIISEEGLVSLLQKSCKDKVAGPVLFPATYAEWKLMA